MPARRSTASHASVVFLRIHDFAQQVVAEQARLEGELGEIVEGALPVLGAGQSVVLDAQGGLAVVVLANPRGALRFAWRAAVHRDLDFSVGLSHGPVRIAPGPLQVVYGDALVAAEAVAPATQARGVSASREFRDAPARAHPGMRRLLAPTRSAHDAPHPAREMYRPDPEAFAGRGVRGPAPLRHPAAATSQAGSHARSETEAAAKGAAATGTEEVLLGSLQGLGQWPWITSKPSSASAATASSQRSGAARWASSIAARTRRSGAASPSRRSSRRCRPRNSPATSRVSARRRRRWADSTIRRSSRCTSSATRAGSRTWRWS